MVILANVVFLEIKVNAFNFRMQRKEEIYTYVEVSADVADRKMYVERPMGGTFALNNIRYLVVDACGASPLNALFHCHTGIT